MLVFEEDDISEPTEVETSDDRECLRLNIDNLEAVSEAIERLNHIGTAIRQSSVTSRATKAREFSKTFNFTSFEKAAYLALKSMYGAASEDLLEFLSHSMRETYALFCRRKARQDMLQVRRVRETPNPLSTISEEPASDTDTAKLQMSQLAGDPIIMMPPAQSASGQTSSIPLRSEPTSMDSREVKARIRKISNQRVKGTSTSTLVSQADYPRPAKESQTCDWCFIPLSKDVFEGDKWKYVPL